MGNDFERAFDDFLTERMGEEVARLRESNERYGSALSEYSELIQKAEYNGVDDYRQAFERLAELAAYIRDTESRFYFYNGMAMHKRMDDAVSSLPCRKGSPNKLFVNFFWVRHVLTYSFIAITVYFMYANHIQTMRLENAKEE